MQFDRKHRLNRIILITAAILSIILSFYLCFGLSPAKNIRILVIMILPALLLFIALKYPSMIYSTIFAGIGTFWSVLSIFLVLYAVWMTRYGSLSESEFGFEVFLVMEGLGFICAIISTAKAVALVKILREDEKVSEAADGIDQMTKGLTRFLFPRNSYPIIMTISLSILLFCIFRLWSSSKASDEDTDIVLIVLIVIIAVAIPSFVLFIVKNIRRYRSYIRDLSESGVLDQAVYDYYQGKEYCKDSVVLGQKCIFVKGAAKIYEYSGIEEISHSWSEGTRDAYWRLIAKNTDGTEYTLVELPFRHNKKEYDNYVLPMLDEIKKINSVIQIGGPGKFS